MLVKEQLYHIADELPSDALIEEAIEQMIFCTKSRSAFSKSIRARSFRMTRLRNG